MRAIYLNPLTRLLALAGLLALGAQAAAQEQVPSNEDIADLLRSGNYVLLMRHASSPRQEPDAASANQDNPQRERQLDEAGRRGASAMGEALRRLEIPVDQVLTSPAYRARETAMQAGFEDVETDELLGSESMRQAGEEASQWLLEQLAVEGEEGNRLLITHGPNISGVLPAVAAVAEGEMLIIDPDGLMGPEVVARIPAGRWADL